MALLAVIDASACALLAWVCGSLLLSRHGNGLVAVGCNLALLSLGVSMVALAFMPLVETRAALGWELAARVAGAVVAAILYEERLGWSAQARALWDSVERASVRGRIAWRRLRAHLLRTRSPEA